jgi:hypothetical protein
VLVPDCWLIWVRWRKAPAGPVEGAGLDPVELPAQFGPGGAAVILGDAGQEQGDCGSQVLRRD